VGKPSLNAAQLYAKAEGRVFLLVPAYPGSPGTKAIKRLLLLLSYKIILLILQHLHSDSCHTVTLYIFLKYHHFAVDKILKTVAVPLKLTIKLTNQKYHFDQPATH